MNDTYTKINGDKLTVQTGVVLEYDWNGVRVFNTVTGEQRDGLALNDAIILANELAAGNGEDEYTYVSMSGIRRVTITGVMRRPDTASVGGCW